MSWQVIYADQPPYNAKGDGVTDDTAALKAFLAAVTSGTTGIIPAPSGGAYIISDTLTIGNGSSTQPSTVNSIVIEGAGSGGAVLPAAQTPAGCTVLRWAATGPTDRPMLKILGPIGGLRLSGILLDGNARCQDGIWDIYQYASEWHDVFTIGFTRVHWFHTAWHTNPIGAVGEGASSNVFVHCGSTGGGVNGTANPLTQTPAAGTYPVIGLVVGGNANDPTDRTGPNYGDPYLSVFLKCRWRFDNSDNSIATELRCSDTNSFFSCDHVGMYSITVAQNPQYTPFPTAYMRDCDASPGAHTPAGAFHMATVGPYVPNGGMIYIDPIQDGSFGSRFNGLYLPWLRGTDQYGSRYAVGYKPMDIVQAVDRASRTISPSDTAFHAFPFSPVATTVAGSGFTIPAANGSVSVPTTSGAGFANNQFVTIVGSGHIMQGTIVSGGGTTSPVVQNLGSDATGVTIAAGAVFMFSQFTMRSGDLALQGFLANGPIMRLRFAGVITTGATPGNVRFQIYVGPNLLADTGSIALQPSQTLASYDLDVQAVSAAANFSTGQISITQIAGKMAFAAATTNAGLYQLMPLTGQGTSYANNNTPQPINLLVAFSASGNTAINAMASYDLLWPEYTAVS